MDEVNHPDHYGGAVNPYEVIKVLEAWKLNFHLGNAVKYIARAGRKETSSELTDLRKAEWYLKRYLCIYEQDQDIDAALVAVQTRIAEMEDEGDPDGALVEA